MNYFFKHRRHVGETEPDLALQSADAASPKQPRAPEYPAPIQIPDPTEIPSPVPGNEPTEIPGPAPGNEPMEIPGPGQNPAPEIPAPQERAAQRGLRIIIRQTRSYPVTLIRVIKLHRQH